MVTIESRLTNLKTALTAISNVNVYHYWRPKMSAPFIVWAEEDGSGMWSQNHVGEIVINGSVDYYTRTEFDGNIDLIQSALNGLENCGWNLESVDYEDDTNLIHYSWSFSLG